MDCGRFPVMIELSLNEVEMIAFRAARGSGLEWGEAEEAGLAARWLAWQGFDWAGPLESGLAGDELHVGLPLCDRLRRSPGRWCDGGASANPMWQVAVLATLSASVPMDVEIAVEGASSAALSLRRGRMHVAGPLPQTSLRVRLVAGDVPPVDARLHPLARDRPKIGIDSYRRLTLLVEQICVPAGEASRLRGTDDRPPPSPRAEGS